ncbi:hypothetical protein M378DRAFT_750334 [Amanita muscaria Koide BX008]|uniref:Uncharacterized protein n=1 Tax=Amanita muscaria (strain Koide BX008) TaxID=946122 RepID=A0A0C2X216_AMAMK|nr:hypothetical protein M378DRAFT_750334 [Amanita muscaria Koide BX008]
MLRCIRKVFKLKGKKKTKSNFSTPVPITVAELENQAFTDAHERANLGMVNDQEHDQEGSESTSSEYFSVAEDLHSVDHGDSALQGREVPSMSFFQGSSNVKNINPIFNQIHGDATFIRFGDGQFTDVQRNLVRRIYTDGQRLTEYS